MFAVDRSSSAILTCMSTFWYFFFFWICLTNLCCHGTYIFSISTIYLCLCILFDTHCLALYVYIYCTGLVFFLLCAFDFSADLLCMRSLWFMAICSQLPFINIYFNTYIHIYINKCLFCARSVGATVGHLNKSELCIYNISVTECRNEIAYYKLY